MASMASMAGSSMAAWPRSSVADHKDNGAARRLASIRRLPKIHDLPARICGPGCTWVLLRPENLCDPCVRDISRFGSHGWPPPAQYGTTIPREWRAVVVNLAVPSGQRGFIPTLCAQNGRIGNVRLRRLSCRLPTDPRSQCYLRRVRSACWPLAAGVGGEFGALGGH